MVYADNSSSTDTKTIEHFFADKSIVKKFFIQERVNLSTNADNITIAMKRKKTEWWDLNKKKDLVGWVPILVFFCWGVSF